MVVAAEDFGIKQVLSVSVEVSFMGALDLISTG
jgi:hypothetical protein